MKGLLHLLPLTLIESVIGLNDAMDRIVKALRLRL